MSKDNYLKIRLKNNWDFPQNYQLDEESGVFIGRIKEMGKIKDIFLRKSQSSILISGPRGRGKTSLVYKIIRDLKQEKKYFLMPVIVNAAQLEIENLENNTESSYVNVKNNQINCLTILENLIRRLYASLDDEIKEIKFRKNIKLSWQDTKLKYRLLYFKNFKVSKIYKKCLATEWNKLENKEKIKKLFFGARFTWSIPFIAFIGLVLSYFMNKAALVLFGSLGLIFIISIFIMWENRTNELYRFDKNLSNLEHDFRKLFKKKGKLKIIFVIDELDYLSVDSDGEQKIERYRSVVLPLIKLYKNLFHFIPAVFCFIGDDDFYKQINEDGIFSTLFTEIFYLSYPKQAELYNFLDSIRHSKCKTQLNGDVWNQFKYYLIYKSKGDFKRINRVIKDYVKIENNNSYLIVPEKEISNKIKIQSRAYKLLCQIYDNSMFTKISDFNKNDELFNSLYEVINEKVWNSDGYVFTFASGEVKEYQEKFLEFLGDCIDKQKKDNEILLLGNINCDIEKIPDNINDYLPHEEKLKIVFESFKKKLEDYKSNLKLDNEYITWIENSLNIKIQDKIDEFNDNFPKLDTTGKSVRDTMNRQDAEEMMNSIKSISEILNNKFTELLKTRILEFKEINNCYNICLVDEENQKIFALLSEAREEIKQTSHFVLYSPDNFSKQLIVVNDDNDKIKKWNEQIEKKGLSFSYKVVGKNFNLDEILKWLKNYNKEYCGHKWFIKNGVPQFLKDELVLNLVDGITRNNSGQLNTFIVTDDNISSVNFECEVEIDQGGILDFIIDYQQDENNKEKYYIARLDTRNGKDRKLCGSGILLEGYEPVIWQYVNISKDKNFENPNKWIKIGISLQKKNIKFYKYTETKKGTLRKSIIESIKVAKNINGKFGFFNELSKCKIKNIKINKK